MAAFTLAETMTTLEGMGTAQHRKIYQRHGAHEPLFGVSFANLNALKKRIKTHQPLAEELWETGNADARYLATLIADPATITAKCLERWAGGMDHYVEVELLARHVAGPSPHALKKIGQWREAKGEWKCGAGWAVLANVALLDNDLDDSYFLNHLATIEQRIHGAKNRVRHEMNGAVIAIGIRNDALERAAVAAAERIGKVEVDHGQTGCKTPDAIPYIAKARAHRRKKSKAG